MGAVVAAACMSHSPGITGFPDRADPAQARAVQDAVATVAADIAAAHPDAVVVVTGEHFTNFSLANLPSLAVGAADAYDMPATDAFARFLRIPRRRAAGHRQLGEALHQGLVDREFDPALVAGGYGFDEGVAVPMALVSGTDRQVPVVPVVINTVQPPYPTLRRCYHLGRALAEIVAEQRVAARVAMVGSGGLSHWVGLAQAGTIDQELDETVLRALAEGKGESLCDLTSGRLDQAGNGAHEIRAWLTVAATVEPARWERLAYEAVPPWLTGTAVMRACLGR